MIRLGLSAFRHWILLQPRQLARSWSTVAVYVWWLTKNKRFHNLLDFSWKRPRIYVLVRVVTKSMALALKMTRAVTGMRASSLDDLDIVSRYLDTHDAKTKISSDTFGSGWPDPRSMSGSLESRRDLASLLPKSHRSRLARLS